VLCCCVARRGGVQRAGKVGPGVKGVTRGAVAKLEGACDRPRKVGSTDCRGRGAEQTGRLEEGEKRLKCNFRNFRDPTINQQ